MEICGVDDFLLLWAVLWLLRGRELLFDVLDNETCGVLWDDVMFLATLSRMVFFSRSLISRSSIKRVNWGQDRMVCLLFMNNLMILNLFSLPRFIISTFSIFSNCSNVIRFVVFLLLMSWVYGRSTFYFSLQQGDRRRRLFFTRYFQVLVLVLPDLLVEFPKQRIAQAEWLAWDGRPVPEQNV